jgi:hypothetical protein
MVKATVSVSTEKFDLETLKGGYVELRRMTYGQKLKRMEMATQSTVRERQNGNRQQRRRARNADVDAEMDIKMLTRVVAEFEFRHCIVDHNLEDDSGNKLNFQVPQTLDVLDPRVGDEINTLIADMNNFEEAEDDDLNSKTGSELSS